MNSIEQFGLIDLTNEELLTISGGDKAMNTLGKVLGWLAAAIVDVAESFWDGVSACENGQVAMHNR